MKSLSIRDWSSDHTMGIGVVSVAWTSVIEKHFTLLVQMVVLIVNSL